MMASASQKALQGSQTFMEMHRSLKKRCWADQNSLKTSRLCPVSSTASLNAPLRSCRSPYGVVIRCAHGCTDHHSRTDGKPASKTGHTCQMLTAASYNAVWSAVSSHLSSMNSAFLQACNQRG